MVTPLPFNIAQSQLSVTWERFPDLNIPLGCLCLVYVFLVSTALHFMYSLSYEAMHFLKIAIVFSPYH